MLGKLKAGTAAAAGAARGKMMELRERNATSSKDNLYEDDDEAKDAAAGPVRPSRGLEEYEDPEAGGPADADADGMPDAVAVDVAGAPAGAEEAASLDDPAAVDVAASGAAGFFGDADKVAAAAAAVPDDGADASLSEARRATYLATRASAEHALTTRHAKKNEITDKGNKALDQRAQAQLLLSAVQFLLAFELVRDWFQVLAAVVRTQADALSDSSALAWSQGMYTAMAATFSDLSESIPAEVDTALAVLFLAVALFCALRLSGKGAESSESAARSGFGQTAQGQRKDLRAVSLLVLVITTVYQPVVNSVTAILTYDISLWSDDEKRLAGRLPYDEFDPDAVGVAEYDKPSCGAAPVYLTIPAWAALLLVVVAMPAFLLRQARRARPAAATFDATTGGVNTNADRDYALAVQGSASPFKSMLLGFRREWPSYKVLMMTVKALSTVIAVALTTENCLFNVDMDTIQMGRTRSALLMLLNSTMLFLTAWQPVFDNALLASADLAIKALASAISMLEVAAFMSDSSGVQDGVTYGLIALNFVTLCIALSVLFRTHPRTSACLKRLSKRLDLSERPARDEGSSAQVATCSADSGRAALLAVAGADDLADEMAARVWRPFWDSLMMHAAPPLGLGLAPPGFPQRGAPVEVHTVVASPDCPAPTLVGLVPGNAGQRHFENREVAAAIGRATYEAAAAKPAADDEALLRAMLAHGSSDSYWRPAGKERGAWGHAYPVPFPNRIVFLYDTLGYAVISNRDEVEQFLQQNTSDEVRRGFDLRQQLRGLNGQKVKYEYQELRTFTKERNVEKTVYNHHTKKHEATMVKEQYQVEVMLTFKRGDFWVMHERQDLFEGVPISQGFAPTISYADGTGKDKEGTKYTRQTATIQIYPADGMDATPETTRLLSENKGDSGKFVKVLRRHRQHMAETAAAHHTTLPYTFWSNVYSCPGGILPREKLDEALAEPVERVLPGPDGTVVRANANTNPAVLSIADEHAAGLGLLYRRAGLVTEGRLAEALWYCFWDDVWQHNVDVAEIGQNPKAFSPQHLSSLAYRILPRDRLEEFLGGLSPELPKFFNDKVLNQLYATLERLA